MIVRKLFKQNSSYVLVIPKDLVDLLGLGVGSKLSFQLRGKKIVLRAEGD